MLQKRKVILNRKDLKFQIFVISCCNFECTVESSVRADEMQVPISTLLGSITMNIIPERNFSAMQLC